MINQLLIKLTENDKRIIFILLGVFILLLIIIGYIGYLVTIIMKWQGKKINNYVTDAVVTGVIGDEDSFRKYAKRKNRLVFYRQARIPALIMTVGIIFYIVASIFVGFVNPFNHVDGFGTLFFIWDFRTIITVPESGAGILLNWPAVVNTPHFVADAWVSYVSVPLVLIGGFWYLFTVQAYIARYLQIKKLGQKIFGDRIENFTAGQPYQAQPQPTSQPQNPNPTDDIHV